MNVILRKKALKIVPKEELKLQISKHTIISIVPLEIFVGIDNAWKKDVFSGPKPVF